MIVTTCLLIDKLLEMLRDLSAQMPSQFQSPEAGIGIGIIVGAKLGFFLFKYLFVLMWAVSDNRTERLLVKYYEEAILARDRNPGFVDRSTDSQFHARRKKSIQLPCMMPAMSSSE